MNYCNAFILSFKTSNQLDEFLQKYDDGVELAFTVDNLTVDWVRFKTADEKTMLYSCFSDLSLSAYFDDICKKYQDITIESFSINTETETKTIGIGNNGTYSETIVTDTEMDDEEFFHAMEQKYGIFRNLEYEEDASENMFEEQGFLLFKNGENEEKTVSIEAVRMTLPPHYEIPSRLTLDGEEYAVTYLGSTAFGGHTELESVFIPDCITGLDHAVFGHCTNLKEIHIPASVASYGEYVFSDCHKDLTIYIPHNNKYIKELQDEYPEVKFVLEK